MAGRVKSCGCLKRVKRSKSRGTGFYNNEEQIVKNVKAHPRLISVMSRPVHEYHSHIGSKVEEAIEVVDENGFVNRVWVTVVCDECSGVVRYNKHNLKECSNCGLIYE